MLRKAICLCLFAAVVLTNAIAFGRIAQENRGFIKADGGAPMPPPIPWSAPMEAPRLVADGGAPMPPPIPWSFAGQEMGA